MGGRRKGGQEERTGEGGQGERREGEGRMMFERLCSDCATRLTHTTGHLTHVQKGLDATGLFGMEVTGTICQPLVDYLQLTFVPILCVCGEGEEEGGGKAGGRGRAIQ